MPRNEEIEVLLIYDISAAAKYSHRKYFYGSSEQLLSLFLRDDDRVRFSSMFFELISHRHSRLS